MMRKFLYIIILNLVLVGCSNDEKAQLPPAITLPQLSSITGSSIKISATDDPQLVESVIILTDDNNPIPDGTQFKLVADTVKINSVDSSSENDWKSEIFVSSNEGKFSFYVKPHTVAGLYRVNAYPVENSNVKFDQGINARYFINIVAGPTVSLGVIKTDFFQDLANYNSIKDSNESWIVTSNPDFVSYISVGPIADIYGNLVEEGSINFNVDQGLILSENPTKILSGYSYFSYKSDGTIGNVISDASVINHPKNVVLSLSETLKKTAPQISLSRVPDFSGMTVGQSKCEVIDVINNGSMVSTNLDLNASFPFLLIDENQGDPLCPLTTNVCKLRQSLRSGESCSLRVKFTMPSTSVSDGDLTIQVDPQEFSSSLLIQKLRTQSVQAAQLVSSNPFISFGGTQCSTSRLVDIYIQNIGDFDATGIVVQNPPPNTNQSNPFFSIILPSQDVVMNPNLNSVVNCGTTFPAGRKCRVQIQFNPTSGIPNQALIGKILGNNINPLILSMSGYTIPGNALNTFPITFITPNNSLLPLGMFIGNAQQSRVDVGPIVDACNQKVADGSIISASVTAGTLLQPTLVSNNGFVSFLWNSGNDISRLGDQSINISVGVNGSKSGNLFFRGVDLSLSGVSDFGQVIEGKSKELTVTLTNNGNILAQNLSISANSPLVVIDKGSCGTNQLAPQSSCQIIVRADPQGINQDLTIPLIASSSSLGSQNTSLNFTLSARTKPVLSFDKSDYLFNNGLVQSVYTQDIILTNNGPAISYDTISNIEAPFFIQSTTCSSTLNINESCIITVGLNNSDAILAVNKKLSISNEVSIEEPTATLGFSRLQINQPSLLGIQNRCFGPYNVSIVGNSGVINSSLSQIINLGSLSSNILFFTDSLCSSGNEITSVQINSNSTLSSNFYLKNPFIVTDSIVASHSSISSGFLSAQFNEELNLNVPVPNALINDEILDLIPSGGYGPFTIEIVGGSSPYAELINELDENLDPTGNKKLKVLTVLGSQSIAIKVTDSLGYFKDITFDLYQPLSGGGSITVRNGDPISISSLFNSYGNPNLKEYKIQRFSGSYIDGSSYGSTVNSNGIFQPSSGIPSNTTEYVLLSIPKFTGGFSESRVSILVNLEWPYGTLGDLVVNSGQTVTLNSSQSYDYNSIWVKSGGTLYIYQVGGKESEPVYVGAVGNIQIDGYVYSRVYFNESSSISVISPDNKLISYSNYLSRGGTGGYANCGVSGGGGGGAPYGSSGPGAFGGYYGAGGGLYYGGAGGSSAYCDARQNPSWRGGNGGNAGMNGGIIYLKSHNQILGNGVIDINGNNGFAGTATTQCASIGGSGGGGGGGGGGAGGKLFYKSTNTISGLNIYYNGAAGGPGGPQGGHSCTNGGLGSGGTAGSWGPSGAFIKL